jgi:hypothetical protein
VRGPEKRTSAANARCGEVAGYGRVIYGTAEAVPFRDRVLTQAIRIQRTFNYLRHDQSCALYETKFSAPCLLSCARMTDLGNLAIETDS